ncbi:MAG: polysulfide reductase [Pseudonocardiales bacterium]|nr:polysulfide reductase [Pseudonocardiales bacterium]
MTSSMEDATTSPGEPTPLGHEAVPAAMGHDRSGRGGRRRGRRRDEHQMVPDAVFTSYYGRPIVKASPWEADIPAYLFMGGLAAGSSLLGAGADLTGRPNLCRVSRLTAVAAITASLAALVHDLGKPSRFLNMLRVMKVTSPMSVGTWIVSAYSPLVYIAGASELPGVIPRPLRGILGWGARPAGITAALVAPAVASYTGVLLADTATPTWNSARSHLPFLFAASAAAASGGMGLLAAPTVECGPARRLAICGAVVELAIEAQMEKSMGIVAETLHADLAGRLMKAAQGLTAFGALAAVFAGRSRRMGIASGASLLAGSACTRFGIFEAGQASAKDPKYTVVPQRERMVSEGRPGA